MNEITRLSLYIINQVRLRRLILGISARYLSSLLEHGEAYVSNIESTVNENQYPPHEYPKIAKALNCSIHDLLPPDDMKQTSTGELVEKVILSLNNKADLKLVIEGMTQNGFFDTPVSHEDIAKHLEIKKEEQMELLVEIMSEIAPGRLR